VTVAQQLFAKASLVEHHMLSQAQAQFEFINAESLLQGAFNIDVRTAIQEWRDWEKLPGDPLKTFLECGYMEQIANERGAINLNSVSSYA
jgi:L-rhamnose isomerase/sugar isomerase